MAYNPDKTPSQFWVHIHAPKQPQQLLRDFRCVRCSRTLFQSNSKQMFISNLYGAHIQDLPPSTNAINIRCHTCKSEYNVLFQ